MICEIVSLVISHFGLVRMVLGLLIPVAGQCFSFTSNNLGPVI